MLIKEESPNNPISARLEINKSGNKVYNYGFGHSSLPISNILIENIEAIIGRQDTPQSKGILIRRKFHVFSKSPASFSTTQNINTIITNFIDTKLSVDEMYY